MQANTVLGHLAHRFPGQQENLATEALCFILRTSPAASRAFTEFLRPIGLDIPGGLYFEAQRAGLEQSIPDMKCRDDKGLLRVTVENKFWAGLTENQPVTYIQELFHELPVGIAALLFVVPKARVQPIWGEVVRRCEAAGIPVGETQNLAAMTAAHLGEGHYLAATTWGELLGALSAALPLAGEIDCRNDIAQLQGLCKTMDEEEILPLSGDELTDLDMARRFINFSDLALEIVYKAESRGLCNRNKAVPTKYGAGTSVQIGEYKSWVGFDAKSWLRLGVSPIWVYFYAPPLHQTTEVREKLVRFRTGAPQPSFDSYNGLLVPIVLKTGVEKQSIIEDAVDQIREIVDALGIQEPSATAPSRDPTDDLDKEPEYYPDSETIT